MLLDDIIMTTLHASSRFSAALIEPNFMKEMRILIQLEKIRFVHDRGVNSEALQDMCWFFPGLYLFFRRFLIRIEKVVISPPLKPD